MYLFTSESVSPGHPDKCADIIADNIVDHLLKNDPNSRIAAEVFVAGKKVVIGGEVTSAHQPSNEEYHDIVVEALHKIGYTGVCGFSNTECLYPEDIETLIFLNKQSPDINQGVDQTTGEIGAGDQGIMFGFASDEADEYMPAAISYSRQICNTIYEYAKANPKTLGVDIKTQVTVDYGTKDNFESAKPQKIHTIVASAPSNGKLHIDEVRTLIQELINRSGLPENLYNQNDCIIHINPTGRYVNHSSLHDSGLTGRKLIVDSFGGYAPIGGGAQSSKDYTKVDRSGLYAARWIAKHIVASGLARKALVQLSYAIGVARPTSVSVDMMGTQLTELDDVELSALVSARYALTPRWITEKFNLDKPGDDTFNYAEVAAKGQVGIAGYPWEELDDIEWFKGIA